MKRVLLLLPNGFVPYEASAFADVLSWNRLEGDGSTEVTTCGRDSRIQDAWRKPFIPEITTSSAMPEAFDALAIPGGFEEAGFYEDAYSGEFLRLIRGFDREGKTIATICVGAMPLGKSGVLSGRKATTYLMKDGYRQKELASFGAVIVNQPFVVDGNIITSSSPAAAVDVTFTLLSMLTSAENSLKVKQLMGF